MKEGLACGMLPSAPVSTGLDFFFCFFPPFPPPSFLSNSLPSASPPQPPWGASFTSQFPLVTTLPFFAKPQAHTHLHADTYIHTHTHTHIQDIQPFTSGWWLLTSSPLTFLLFISLLFINSTFLLLRAGPSNL